MILTMIAECNTVLLQRRLDVHVCMMHVLKNISLIGYHTKLALMGFKGARYTFG